MRQLTTKYSTYKLGQYERKTGKGIMDLLDIGNLEVNKIANIILLGNPQMKDEEEAYQRLDEYLSSDEEHSIISAFFDLIDELDKDLKIMKSCGIKVSDIKEQFKAEVEKGINNTGLTNPKELVDKAKETNTDETNTDENNVSTEIIEMPTN